MQTPDAEPTILTDGDVHDLDAWCGPPTTCPSGRSISWTTRCYVNHYEPSTSNRASSDTGAPPGSELRLRASQPRDPRPGSRHDLHHGARPRWARAGRRSLARRNIQRDLPRHLPGRIGHASPVHPVLVPRGHTQSRGPGDPRIHPRGRRTRVFAVPRVRRRVRQPRSRGRSGHRRRRSRNRPTRRELAFQQIRRSTPRRCRTSDPAPQRIQDRRSHASRPHRRRRTRIAPSRIRTRTDRRFGSRPRIHAPALRRRAGPLSRPHHRDPTASPTVRQQRSTVVADDRAAFAERMDRTGGGRRAPDRRHMAAHQVPFAHARDDDEHRDILEHWLRSYRPDELFDDNGTPVPDLRA